MTFKRSTFWTHAKVDRRTAIHGGVLTLAGLSMAQLQSLRAVAPPKKGERFGQAKAAIYIFLSGGLGQHDSFDPKPDAPANIRGEFKPIATRTPGFSVVEHLPRLAACSQHWSVIRSLTHKSNDHSASHHMMLTMRSDLPRGFDPNKPKSTDHPSLVSVAGAALVDYGSRGKNNLPPAVVLPERLVHNTGRVIPGQFASGMNASREAWFIEASPFTAKRYGAFPEFDFDHQQRIDNGAMRMFGAPSLDLPPFLAEGRLEGRISLRERLDRQAVFLDQAGPSMDVQNQLATSLLTNPKLRASLEIKGGADEARYGKNAFGWSLLMARRLVGQGIPLVQVNLGNNETWDTHGNAFPHLKDKLLPPFDRGLAALLEDLAATGELDQTVVFVAGEFGRTPKITRLPEHYKLPGRDHWGAVQSVLIAGGGIPGGSIIGSSDKDGAYPKEHPQSPENLGATIYHALGIPKDAAWKDATNRPNFVYHGTPIAGL